MLSARLAKVLNLLITSLTTCLCNAREHVANPERLGRKQPTEMTTELQSNYPNFKQNLTEENCHLKSQRKPASVGKCRLRDARFQKLTTRALSKEIRISKQKIIPKSRVFSENTTKRFLATTRRLHDHSEDAEGY